MPFHLLLNAPAATPGSNLYATFVALPMTVATMAGLPITATLTFSEVARHVVVPEPTSFSLVGLGLLGLAGGAGWRARRARRS
jgi:MYXO-CTERM domain-containing protein